MTDTATFDLDDLAPGERLVCRPLDGVELEVYGLASGEALDAPVMVVAEVTTPDGRLAGIYHYDLVAIDHDDEGEPERFVVEADGPSNKRAADAIAEIGGRVR